MSSSNSDIVSAQPSIAVIGSGYWGKNLIRNFYDLSALKFVCDKNEILLDHFQDQYSGIKTCLALNDILSSDDIEGVVIATPAETHFTMVREAILAGKHVYVEKPMALRSKEGEELVYLAEKNKRILMVGHLLHYHPAFMRLKELVGQGELGRINYIYSNRLNLGKIRREENILWSFAPHDISMILSIAGERPETIITVGGNYLHQRIADVTLTHLNFPSGLKAHVFVSWLHPVKEQRLVVVGDKKMAVFDDTQPWESKLLLFAHKIEWISKKPVPTKSDPESVVLNEKEPLREECAHFLDCIKNGEKPITDGKEGLRVLEVLNASQLSLEESGTEIHLETVSKKHLLPKINKEYFIHPTAIIDEDVSIENGVKIWHFSHILSGSMIGEKSNIGQNVVIGPDVTVGKSCKVQNNVSIYKGVTLEDKVFCGPSMVFTNVYNPRSEIQKMDQLRATLVKKGATIGANATIICGVVIGRYCLIGAGSVVTKNVQDHALIAGNPARPIGWVCECGETLEDSLTCAACGKKYKKTAKGLEMDNL
ncbi:MAG: Gfo/Idh/MocA family oxidoreductase [Thermodesulfobacteriota bacterium]|nr:Gfo/Idh/MocA family oxidoreductase [Thermodesulfobacteriota bacterium]